MTETTLEFIKNTLDAIQGYLRDATDLLEQGCGLYDEDENQATYGALFAALNRGIHKLPMQESPSILPVHPIHCPKCGSDRVIVHSWAYNPDAPPDVEIECAKCGYKGKKEGR
jgi:DNA-directed RNA polymerase subunit RPC12/RpoP